MSMIDDLKERLRREEGVKQFPYEDTQGKLTIGIGHNITDRGLSKTIVENLLDEDIHIAMSDAFNIFPMFYSYSEPRQIAILDLLFAMGRPVFLKFDKMIQAIKEGNWVMAATELLDSAWAKQTGTRAFGLAELLQGG
jgi:lysozyme